MLAELCSVQKVAASGDDWQQHIPFAVGFWREEYTRDTAHRRFVHIAGMLFSSRARSGNGTRKGGHATDRLIRVGLVNLST